MTATAESLKYGSIATASSPAVLKASLEHTEESDVNITSELEDWNVAVILDAGLHTKKDLTPDNQHLAELPMLRIKFPVDCPQSFSHIESRLSVYKIHRAIDISVLSIRFNTTWVTLISDLNRPKVSMAIRDWQGAGALPIALISPNGQIGIIYLDLDGPYRKPLENVILLAAECSPFDRMALIREAIETIPELRAGIPKGSKVSAVYTMDNFPESMREIAALDSQSAPVPIG